MKCFNCGKDRAYVMIHIDPGPYKDARRLRERKTYVVRSEYPICLECLATDYRGVERKLEGQIVTSYEERVSR